MESASSGLLAGLNLARRLSGQETLVLPETTMLGALGPLRGRLPGEGLPAHGGKLWRAAPLA